MPKIGKLKINTRDRAYTYELNYNDDRGFFCKDFPENILGFMRNKDGNVTKLNSAETKAELQEQLQKITREYYDLTKTRKKVITIDVGMTLALWGTNSSTRDGGYVFNSGDRNEFFKDVKNIEKHNKADFGMNSYKAFGLTFEYAVGFIVTTDAPYFHKLIEPGDEGLADPDNEEMSQYGSKIHDKTIVVDFTEERLNFLNQLRDAMMGLGAKLFTTLTDQTVMQETIDRNLKLLSA